MDLLRIHKALADETRLRLCAILMRCELNVGELTEVLGMGQPRISRHLKILVEAGLAECRREGLRAFYRVVAAGPVRRFLDCQAEFFDAEPACRRDRERAARVLHERAVATRRFFDSVAGRWCDLSHEVLGDFDLAGELAGRLPSGVPTADLGCGPGELLSRLAADGRSVIGVDGSPRMLELAASRLAALHPAGRPNVSLRLGELEHLPLREAEVGAATLSLVLHHVSDPVAVLSEARRVLAPGGELLVAEFDRHANEAMRVRYGDARLGVARETLDKWLRAAGFVLRRLDAFPVNQGLTVLLAAAKVAATGGPEREQTKELS